MLDVVGNIGAVDPAQKGAMEVNVGVNIGFVNCTPVKRLVVQPLITKEMFEYIPAFNPDIIICPEAFATRVSGPTGAPSSV